LGRLDEAVAWFRKAVALDPAQASAPAQLGLIYLDLGDSTQAEFWLNRTQELEPGPFWLNSANEIIHYYRGEEEQALNYGRELLAIDPRSVPTLRHLRDHDLQAGRYVEARARYARGYPALFEDGSTIDGSNIEPALDLALVLRKTGERERADAILGRALAFLQAAGQQGDMYNFSDVRLYALQGNTDAALAALGQAVDQGRRTSWWFYLERDPSLDSIRDERGFQRVLDEIRTDMAAQLAKVRAMEASGELASIPDIN
jgi:tetratricopeptide (TPR) repeat protein